MIGSRPNPLNLDEETLKQPLSKITDLLYIGNLYDALDHNNLRANQIQVIVNCVGPMTWLNIKDMAPFPAYSVPTDIEYYAYPLAQPFGPTMALAHNAARIVNKCLINGQRVFVHCLSGRDRSPTVSHKAMVDADYSPEKAEALIRQARPMVKIHHDWWEDGKV